VLAEQRPRRLQHEALAPFKLPCHVIHDDFMRDRISMFGESADCGTCGSGGLPLMELGVYQKKVANGATKPVGSWPRAQ
jgi:hypothetical protein